MSINSYRPAAALYTVCRLVHVYGSRCLQELSWPAKWRSDGHPVHGVVCFITGASLEPRWVLSDDMTTFTVKDVCKSCTGQPNGDLMVIQCIAWNIQGYAASQGYLNVLSKYLRATAVRAWASAGAKAATWNLKIMPSHALHM